MPVPKVECGNNPKLCGRLFVGAPMLVGYGIPLTTADVSKGYGLLECKYGETGSICPIVQAMLAKVNAAPQPVQTR